MANKITAIFEPGGNPITFVRYCEYKILRDNYAYMLEDAVNRLCKEEGWNPAGGVCFCNGVFFQSLTRMVETVENATPTQP